MLWKIAFQITRLYKAHINLGPEDIQIAFAPMLYRDDTLLIMSGCEDAARCTPSGKQTRSFLREDPRRRAQAQQRHFALRFKPFAEEINSNCTGKEVNWNSKLGQPTQRAFSLHPGGRHPRKQPPQAQCPAEMPDDCVWKERPLLHVQGEGRAGTGR